MERECSFGVWPWGSSKAFRFQWVHHITRYRNHANTAHMSCNFPFPSVHTWPHRVHVNCGLPVVDTPCVAPPTWHLGQRIGLLLFMWRFSFGWITFLQPFNNCITETFPETRWFWWSWLKELFVQTTSLISTAHAFGLTIPARNAASPERCILFSWVGKKCTIHTAFSCSARWFLKRENVAHVIHSYLD